jgi:hypothetical protein
MGFSRLEKVGDFYMDKFVEPIINEANLEENSIYFAYGKTGMHKTPRLYKDNIYYLDFPYISFYILAILISPFILLSRFRSINAFFKDINTEVLYNQYSILHLALKTSEAIIQYHFFKYILKKVKAKRLFGVSRVLFFTASKAAKKLGIAVYEIQHGITSGPTRLYAGYYNKDIDPDYFLAFGTSCSKLVFGIPPERIINIGWAFKYHINRIPIETKYPDNTFLIISEPQISQRIIETSILLAECYPESIFHIRRHPQEQFNSEQTKSISKYSNIKDVSSTVNSNIAIMSYEAILGENSTVLYEALSIGKKVGWLAFNGLTPRSLNLENSNGLYYINNLEDFGKFILLDKNMIKSENEIYSDFKLDVFKSLI